MICSLFITQTTNLRHKKNTTVRPTPTIDNYHSDSILRIPILMYHYVEYVRDEKDTIRKSLNINPYIFEEQLKTLKGANYTFTTQNEIASYLKNEIIMPNKPIALTFDDGYRDFYTVAYPLLKKYKAKATIYIIVNFLNDPNYLTEKQLQELSLDNNIEIASHTLNHIHMKSANIKSIQYELSESKSRLEKLIGKPVFSFAYPYGAFSEGAIEEVVLSKYKSAVTVTSGKDQSIKNMYYLYRLRPGARTGNELINYLEN